MMTGVAARLVYQGFSRNYEADPGITVYGTCDREVTRAFKVRRARRTPAHQTRQLGSLRLSPVRFRAGGTENATAPFSQLQ